MATMVTSKYPLWNADVDEPADETMARLDELTLLEEDWDGYDAPPISPVAVAAAKDVVTRTVEEIRRRRVIWKEPYDVGPMPDGGAYLHWDSPLIQFVVQFLPETGEGTLFVRNGPGLAERYQPAASELPAAVADLISQLISLNIATQNGK